MEFLSQEYVELSPNGKYEFFGEKISETSEVSSPTEKG